MSDQEQLSPEEIAVEQPGMEIIPSFEDEFESLQHNDEEENFLGSDFFADDDMPTGATPDVTTNKTAQTEPVKEEVAQPQVDTNWEKRYKDLQSYHDKKRTELEQQVAQYQGINTEEYRQLMALKNVITDDPEILGTIERKLSGKTPQAGTATQQVPQMPQIQLPPKPMDFDPIDAYDLSTPSGQWMQQVEQVKQAQLLQSMQQMIQQQTQSIAPSIMQTLQQQQQAETKRRQEQQARQEFLNRHQDMTQQELEQFENFVAKGPGRQITQEDLYKFYKILNSEPSNGTQNIQQQSIDSKLVSKATVPPSVTRIPSTQSQSASPENDFGMSLLANSKRREIF